MPKKSWNKRCNAACFLELKIKRRQKYIIRMTNPKDRRCFYRFLIATSKYSSFQAALNPYFPYLMQ